MDSPGILVVEVYSYSGVPWATEYLYITSYLCPSAPRCQCFVDTDSFIVRPDIASAAIYCCERSSQFAVNMNRYCRWYKRHIRQRIFRHQHRCLANLNFVLHDELYAKIDFAWGNRLAELSYKWSLLMDATAWLSTLGGGHSALGEHSAIHALRAGSISFKQFRLALELGDRGLEYRCRLYYALSLIQQEKLSQSKKVIRWIYHEAKNSLRDQRLQVMCQGVWSKLQFVYRQRKNTKSKTQHSNGHINNVITPGQKHAIG